MRAEMSQLAYLMCVLSTANGELYLAISFSSIRPEPKQETYSASPRDQRQAGADAVRGVVHRRQPFPVAGPAAHLLLMAGLQELHPAQLALVVQLLDEQKFAGVDDRFHHHVFQAGLRAPARRSAGSLRRWWPSARCRRRACRP